MEFSQEFSNAIHHHFEILIGGRDEVTEYIANSSKEVVGAVTGLNHIIHDLEAYTRNLEAKGKSWEASVFAGVVAEFGDCERFNLPSSFDKYFSMNVNFGDLVVHYSQIGKTWLEAFLDKDEDIFDEAIRPLYAFSGEFDIMFGQMTPDQKFLGDFAQFLKKKGQDISNPMLRLGHLAVARMEKREDMTGADYKKQLAYFCEIKRISAYQGEKCLAEKSFTENILKI